MLQTAFVPGSHVDHFWRMVTIVLEGVFSSQNSSKLSNDVRLKVEQRPISEQVLFYHAEPLHIAMNIKGITATNLTPQHLLRYDTLTALEKWGWP